MKGKKVNFLKRFSEKDKRISALLEQFKEGQYNFSNFLDAIKYQTGLSMASILFML